MAEPQPQSVAERDYRAEKYLPRRVRDLCDYAIEYADIQSPEALATAVEYGNYLSKQGYEFMLTGEYGPLIFKCGWYFSTHQAGITKNPEKEEEFYFCIKIPRHVMRTVNFCDGEVAAATAEMERAAKALGQILLKRVGAYRVEKQDA